MNKLCVTVEEGTSKASFSRLPVNTEHGPQKRAILHAQTTQNETSQEPLRLDVVARNLVILFAVIVPVLVLYGFYLPWKTESAYFDNCLNFTSSDKWGIAFSAVVIYGVLLFVCSVVPTSCGGLGNYRPLEWGWPSFELAVDICNTPLYEILNATFISMFGFVLYLVTVDNMKLYSDNYNIRGSDDGPFYLLYSGTVNTTIWLEQACEYGGKCEDLAGKCGCASDRGDIELYNFGDPLSIDRSCQSYGNLFEIDWDSNTYYEQNEWFMVNLYVVDLVSRMVALFFYLTHCNESLLRTPRLVDIADYLSCMGVLIAAGIDKDLDLYSHLTRNGFNVLLWTAFFRVLRLIHFWDFIEDAVHKKDDTKDPERSVGAIYFPFGNVCIPRPAVSVLKITFLLLAYICAAASLVLACEFPCPILKGCQIYPDGAFDSDECNCNPSFRSYYQCIYFIVVTFSTVGYGDMYPSTNRSRSVIIATIACGVTLIPYLLGHLSQHLSGREEQATDEKWTPTQNGFDTPQEPGAKLQMRALARILQRLPPASDKSSEDEKLVELLKDEYNTEAATQSLTHYRWLVSQVAKAQRIVHLRLLCGIVGVPSCDMPKEGMKGEAMLLAEFFCALILGHSHEHFKEMESKSGCKNSKNVPDTKLSKLHFPSVVLKAFGDLGAKAAQADNASAYRH